MEEFYLLEDVEDGIRGYLFEHRHDLDSKKREAITADITYFVDVAHKMRLKKKEEKLCI